MNAGRRRRWQLWQLLKRARGVRTVPTKVRTKGEDTCTMCARAKRLIFIVWCGREDSNLNVIGPVSDNPTLRQGNTHFIRTIGDIWAFGVVLYEMLTGVALFAGETVSDVLAAVLRADIDLAKLPPSVPPGIRSV